jgi:hypothetical protein
MTLSTGSIATFLRFACGHAAMVSLPRFAGETASQRKLRISTEKASAESRSCDFCPPVDLAVAEAAVAVLHTSADNGHRAPDGATEVAADLVSGAEPVEAEGTSATSDQREPALVAASPALVTLSPAAVDRRSRRSRQATPSRPVKSSAGRVARRRDSVVSETSGATVYQFRVDFTAEVVVEAASIWDALARADEFGPWEITSITRLGG